MLPAFLRRTEARNTKKNNRHEPSFNQRHGDEISFSSNLISIKNMSAAVQIRYTKQRGCGVWFRL